jgi:Zn-dependent protease/ATP-dependent Clp protease adapter protein ClpS
MVKSGAFRILSVAGIDVYLHWTWFLVALIMFQNPIGKYDSPVWNVAEYLSLFGIVLLHEFGHALACRQVGGRADTIMLWPLGGVAFVSPPPRPGAVLWSIVAGPLVNLILMPITIIAVYPNFDFHKAASDPQRFLQILAYMNGFLLIFNLLPVYPLDGGQIVMALLWFLIGQAHALMVVSIMGIVGAAMFLVVASLFLSQDKSGGFFLFLIAGFTVYRSLVGFLQALTLQRILHGPRHQDFACPACGNSPPVGRLWRCDNCQTRFDTFKEHAECPQCHWPFSRTRCTYCGKLNPFDDWMLAVVPAEDGGEPADTNIVLLNDPDHTYEYVIRVLEDVFGYSAAHAALLARKTDIEGRVIVASTSRQRAEVLRDRILAYGPDPLLRRSKTSLRAILEPVEVLPAD